MAPLSKSNADRKARRRRVRHLASCRREEGDRRDSVAESAAGGLRIEPARLGTEAVKPAMDALLLNADKDGYGQVAPARFCSNRFCIHLKISPADREDAWELCRVLLHYGGLEVSACCFAFTNADRWLMALESLRLQFGPEYFEAVEETETHHA